MCTTTTLLTRDQIQSTMERLAEAIRRDYAGQRPVVIGVLQGAFVFVSDLIRALDIPLELDFVRSSSYGARMESSGRVRMLVPLRRPVAGRHVLLVEDIVDTGLTTTYLMGYLRRKRPASLRLCALLDKPACHKTAVAIDYLGFTVPNVFVVGYGIDFNEHFRELSDICTLEVKEHGEDQRAHRCCTG